MPAFFARAAPQFGRFSRAFSKMPMASVPRAAAQARNGLRLAVGRCDRLAVPAAPALAVSAPGASLTARGLSGTALVSAATGTAAASESSTSTAKKVKHNTNSVELTVDHFPELNLKRLPFARLEDSDVAFFTSLLGPAGVITDADELPRYNTDWMQKYRGQSSLVLRPKTTQEVAGIVKYCNDRRLAVVPQGGNTGLVGGSVPVFDEIVISLERVNNIRSFDAVSGILVADAGVILENADKYLADRGFIFPLDLGAKGTCHIGGNVATNAGGLRLLRYGSLHGSVLGLEAVLPDGTVLDTLSTLRKDNTGYDLKQLFIGSEGTLGVITGISIATPKRSSAVNVSMVAVKSFEDVQKVFLKAKEGLGEILSAFEFWDGSATKMVGEKLDGVRNPLGEREGALSFLVTPMSYLVPIDRTSVAL